jgi:phosphoadenosine phosphosulfate reductase
VRGLTAQEVLAQAVERHHPRLVMACSFQKEESVLIDMLMEIEPQARVFTIDTGVLFPETYDVWRAVEERYGLNVEVQDAAGPWSAENCCGEAKVAGLNRALEGAEAWITGVRREQSPTRANAEQVERDEASASCPITRSTTRATPRSAAPPAPCPAQAARGAGPTATRPSADCT